MSLLERIFHFHQEILANNFPNSKTQSLQFEISINTARRDINYLRDRLLAPLEFNHKKNGFYYKDKGFHLPFENSPKLIFLLTMLNKIATESGLGNLPEIKNLENRLSQMISPNYEKVAESIKCQWIEIESIQDAIFETIIEAVAQELMVTIDYVSATGEQSTRTIAPLQVINYQGRWYLYSYCQLRNGYRIFHLARINLVTLTKQSFPSNISSNLEDFETSFGIFSGEPQYNATILFMGTAANLVCNQYWHAQQKMVQTDEGLLLTLPVSDDRELIMKILQYGHQAVVLSPEELVVKLRQETKAMALKYQKEKII